MSSPSSSLLCLRHSEASDPLAHGLVESDPSCADLVAESEPLDHCTAADLEALEEEHADQLEVLEVELGRMEAEEDLQLAHVYE